MTKLILSSLPILMFVSSSFSSDLLPFPFVFSEGKADTSLAPNNAVVTFWVKDVGQESSKAMESVEKRTDELVKTSRMTTKAKK